MKVFNKLKRQMLSTILNDQYYKYVKSGKIIHFDQSFYSQFDGMYFGGLPVYYYLQKLNMGKCYDTSAILALAMGGNAKVCRGELKSMTTLYNDCFGHGWVEADGKVYDTTWQIILDKDLYYKLFKVADEVSVENNQFFENCKEISDWNIYSKEYYENNYVPFVSLNIFQVHEIIKLYLNTPSTTPEDIVFYTKLQQDLPDFDKLILSPPNFLEDPPQLT